MRKILSLCLALTLLAGFMLPVSAEKPVEIIFWHSMGGVNGEAIVKMVEDFNKENEGKIKVNVEYQGTYDDAINKVKAAGMSAMPADVMQIYDIGSRFMIDSGWALPVQEMIDAENYDISQVEPNIAAYYTIDGKLYSMPFNSSTPLLYYNKTAFKEAGLDPDTPPTNFDEIIEMAEKLTIKDADGKTVRWGFGMGNYGWFFEQWIGKMGLHYVDNDNGRSEEPATKVVFDENGGAAEIFKIWKKLFDEGIITYLGRGNTDAKAAFISGDIVITLESTAALKSLLTNVGDDFEIGTGFFPNIHPDDKGGVSIGGGSLWMLQTGDDARQKASWEFIKYMISPDVQAFWNAQTGYFPITVATHELDAFKENLEKFPQFGTAIRQLHSTAPEYAGSLLSVFPESRALVETYTERLINGEVTVDEAVQKLAAEVNSAIEIYNLTN
ncbi:MAG: ABC transporter substrate-binding protein [Christensenellales bacterium]|jgi:sn-glycerol 3-phosphate transport system substrate-binding protein|nr:ABC transporter substrate-binding protein [Christensenellaceae bacterium]